MDIRAIPPLATWPLRQAILRPHQALSEMNYPGDDLPTTRHFAAWREQEIVAIASLYKEALAEEPSAQAWRLRGMAVVASLRRKGTGAKLVEHCVAYAQKQGGTLLWCNARENALPFYSTLGFTTLRGPFELPGIGPHFLLRRPL